MAKPSPLVLAGIPGAAVTSTGIAVELVSHNPILTVVMAGLAGVLAVFGVFLTSTEAQETRRVRTRHRPERIVASAAAFGLRKFVKAETRGSRHPGGRLGTSDDGDRITKSKLPDVIGNLPEIMRITRQDEAPLTLPEQATPDCDAEVPAQSEDGRRFPGP